MPWAALSSNSRARTGSYVSDEDGVTATANRSARTSPNQGCPTILQAIGGRFRPCLGLLPGRNRKPDPPLLTGVGAGKIANLAFPHGGNGVAGLE